MKSDQGPELDEFIRGRSRAFTSAYSDFVKANELAWEDDLWPEAKRAEFAKITATLADEWEERARSLRKREEQ